MINALITLMVALAISAVAAYYSIIGLTAIFASAVIPVAIMGIVLEVGKLVTASWLYQNWKHVPFLLKTYLTGAVITLMFITSMGIFGFLSKAHIEQTVTAGDNTLQIEQIDNNIERKRREITRYEDALNQLDEAIAKFTELGAVTKGLNARKEQEPERVQINTQINQISDNIILLQQEKAELKSEQIKIEAEVGPIKYIAETIYGESSSEILEDAVRVVIIILVVVFDPLAVLLLIAANISFDLLKRKEEPNSDTQETEEPKETKTHEERVKIGDMQKVTRTGPDGSKIEFYE